MRRRYRIQLVVVFLVAGAPMLAAAQYGARDGQWRSYGGDSGGTKYSSLDQIDADNVQRLDIAWRWSSPDNTLVKEYPQLQQFRFEGTPIMVDGVLYVSTGFSQVAAVDAASGKTKWVYDPLSWKQGRPANLGFVHRGLAYWDDGAAGRIFIATGDANLVAIDAQSGKPVPSFGNEGKVDLTANMRRPVNKRNYTVSSPPAVCRNVVVVGSSISDGATMREAPPGDVRGFDARTGKLLWTFHNPPMKGEAGYDTWEDGSAEYTGNANIWTYMSADEELGYVYLPFGTPTNDWYGGHRHGDNLFAESLVCVDAATGKKVWHFQMVHHGLWDYDLPTGPNLVDITKDGKRIKALAQVSKQGFCYVLNRETGEPIWPIEERPVPQSTVPGEKTAPTQPFPTKPAAFERQGLTEDDLIDFTPELKAKALEIFRQYDSGPLFTPPTERGALNMPGWVGGANWSGAAVDPETATLYVPSMSAPIIVTLFKPDSARSNLRYRGRVTTVVDGPEGLPLVKPPYSRVTAIDLNTGNHAWMIPLGDGPRDHPLLKDLNLDSLGAGSRGFPLLTKTLLFICQESFVWPQDTDPYRGVGDGQKTMRAFDKNTGELVHEIELPQSASAAPMTYLAGGRQFVVVAVGEGVNPSTELVAYALQ